MKHKSNVFSQGSHHSEKNWIIFTLNPYHDRDVQIFFRPDHWQTTTFKNKQHNPTPTTSASIDSHSVIVAIKNPLCIGV